MAREVAPPIEAPSFSIETWREDEERYIAALSNLAQEVNEGEYVGEIVRWQRADGYAVYMIWSEKPLEIFHVALGDGYTVEPSLIRGLKLDEVKAMVEWERRWKQSATEPNDTFYGSVKPDDVVHYSNGFGQFIRCKVVSDSTGIQGVKLLPIALVGGLKQEGSRSGWFEWDLYRRMPDGSVHYGYHVKQIVEGERFQPHASSIYEYSESLQKGIDPRTMTPLSLEPPPMDDAKQRIVPLAKAVNAIKERLNSPPWDDEAGMREVLFDVAALALNELDRKE